MTTTEASRPPAAGRPHVDRLVRAHRGRFAWSYVFQVVGGVAPLLQVLLLRAVVDDLVQERTDATQVAWQVAGMFALGLVGVWAAYSTKVVSTRAAGAVIADMQSSMFQRLTTMPIHFYTTVRPGAVVSRLTSDARRSSDRPSSCWTSRRPTSTPPPRRASGRRWASCSVTRAS